MFGLLRHQLAVEHTIDLGTLGFGLGGETAPLVLSIRLFPPSASLGNGDRFLSLLYKPVWTVDTPNPLFTRVGSGRDGVLDFLSVNPVWVWVWVWVGHFSASRLAWMEWGVSV